MSVDSMSVRRTTIRHVSGVAGVRFGIGHAEKERVAVHDNVKLLVIGIDEDLAQRHDLLNVVESGDESEFAYDGNGPEIAQDAENEIKVIHPLRF